jgi:hypothetical protein
MKPLDLAILREAVTQGRIQWRKPLHVVASYDEVNKEAFIITAYEPSLDVFEPDYRTRKKT